MLDVNHHSESFCDFLEAIKKTHKVRPKTSQDLLEFDLSEHILIKMTDIVFSYTELKKKKKRLRDSKNIRTHILVKSNRPFRRL